MKKEKKTLYNCKLQKKKFPLIKYLLKSSRNTEPIFTDFFLSEKNESFLYCHCHSHRPGRSQATESFDLQIRVVRTQNTEHRTRQRTMHTTSTTNEI